MSENKEASKSSFLSDFWKGLKIEFKKITWPNKDDLGKQTLAVTAVTVVTGVIIAIVDWGILYGVNWLVTK